MNKNKALLIAQLGMNVKAFEKLWDMYVHETGVSPYSFGEFVHWMNTDVTNSKETYVENS